MMLRTCHYLMCFRRARRSPRSRCRRREDTATTPRSRGCGRLSRPIGRAQAPNGGSSNSRSAGRTNAKGAPLPRILVSVISAGNEIMADVPQHRRASSAPAPEPAGADAHRTYANAVRAKLFRGLADPARLAILARLCRGSCSAGQLALECDLTPSNASNHLRCLLGCGLVSLERRGRRRVYSLTDPRIGQLIRLSGELLDSLVAS